MQKICKPNARIEGRGRTDSQKTGQSITPRPLECRVRLLLLILLPFGAIRRVPLLVRPYGPASFVYAGIHPPVYAGMIIFGLLSLNANPTKTFEKVLPPSNVIMVSLITIDDKSDIPAFFNAVGMKPESGYPPTDADVANDINFALIGKRHISGCTCLLHSAIIPISVLKLLRISAVVN